MYLGQGHDRPFGLAGEPRPEHPQLWREVEVFPLADGMRRTVSFGGAVRSTFILFTVGQ